MEYKKWMQWSRERCKINLIIVARDYNNTMVVNYIYFVLQSHWKGFGMYSFFIYFSQGVVYVYINVYVCIYIYMQYVYVCMCIYIYIHVCIYIYIYIHIYVCMNRSRRWFFLLAVIFRILQRWDLKYHCWWGECLLEWFIYVWHL